MAEETGSGEKSKEGPGRLRRYFASMSFVKKDYLLLALAVVVFSVAWYGMSAASNVGLAGSFYSKGYKATYELEGTAAVKLGGNRLELETVAETKGFATVEGAFELDGTPVEEGKRLEVDRKTSNLVSFDVLVPGMPLIFYYDIPMKQGDVSKTFGADTSPYFSTELAPLVGRVHARVKRKLSDNVVMWYHKSPERSYGPQFSWEIDLYDEAGVKVATIVNDMTSGLLLDARFYQDGWGSMTLIDTDYPTSLNRWVIFIGFNTILLLWGIYHMVRAGRHKKEWEAHWSSFPLDFKDVSKFFIRLMAFTLFDFLGIALLISDIVGLVLMAYAVGWFAFPVAFKFIPWLAAIGVGAGGRALSYVQYPFGVPLYLIAVVSFLLYRYYT